MTKSRNIIRTRRRWTDAENELMRRLYPCTPTYALAKRLGRSMPTTYQRAALMGLRKSDEYLASPAARRLDGLRGESTRFQPGQQPWNKGTKWKAGGRSAETRFKPGTLNGRAAELIQPIGSYRINTDGVLDRKVRDDGPPQYRWVAVHRLVWIEAHGPIPKGHIVCWKPGRRTTELELITPDALELVSRVELMARNTVHNLPKELAQLVQLRGQVIRKINDRERAREESN